MTIRYRRTLASAPALVWIFCAAGAFAAGLFTPDSGNKEPIEITADRARIEQHREGGADFIGTVKAVQGKFTMTSDTLRVFYSGDLMNPPKDQVHAQPGRPVHGQGPRAHRHRPVHHGLAAGRLRPGDRYPDPNRPQLQSRQRR